MGKFNTKDEDAIRRASQSVKKDPIRAAKVIMRELILIGMVLIGLCAIGTSIAYVLGAGG